MTDKELQRTLTTAYNLFVKGRGAPPTLKIRVGQAMHDALAAPMVAALPVAAAHLTCRVTVDPDLGPEAFVIDGPLDPTSPWKGNGQ